TTTDALGGTTVFEGHSQVIANVDDAATGTLSVTGEAKEGGTLTASLAEVVDADGNTTTAYQWQEKIDGEWTDLDCLTDASLTIPHAQSYVDNDVLVVATTTDVLGGKPLFDGGSHIIANVDDAATGTLTVTGAAEEGGTLTADLTDVVDVDGAITSTTYQWQ